MSEAEKRLRAWMDDMAYGLPNIRATGAVELDALLTEHRAEVSSARDAALEEAAMTCRAVGTAPVCPWEFDIDEAEARIRALKSNPGECYLPEAKVREVLLRIRHEAETDTRLEYADVCGGGWAAAGEVARRLGVDLDAKGETPEEPWCQTPGCIHRGPCLDANGVTPVPIRTISRSDASANDKCAKCSHLRKQHGGGKGRCFCRCAAFVESSSEAETRCPPPTACVWCGAEVAGQCSCDSGVGP